MGELVEGLNDFGNALCIKGCCLSRLGARIGRYHCPVLVTTMAKDGGSLADGHGQSHPVGGANSIDWVIDRSGSKLLGLGVPQSMGPFEESIQ